MRRRLVRYLFWLATELIELAFWLERHPVEETPSGVLRRLT